LIVWKKEVRFDASYLKDIFEGAATKVSSSNSGPFHDFYQHLLAQGRKHTMARLTFEITSSVSASG
jgi:hypothetical protein